MINRNPTEKDRAKAISEIKRTKGSDSTLAEEALKKELGAQYQSSWEGLRNLRASWDDKEAILLGKSFDNISTTTKSQVSDPRLSTILFERAARVMAQLPTGEVQALTMDDVGKNQLMNLVVQKYIYPNANAQHDLLTKFRMWDIYSGTYGSFPMLVDYRIDRNYIGPDCYLVPMRNFMPQPGRVSVQESDYCFVETWVSVAWLKTRNPKFWKNIDKVIKWAKEHGETKQQLDAQKRTILERSIYQYISPGEGDTAMIRLTTRYEPDRWVTFVPGFDMEIVRDIENPQKNNKIPIVLKHCFPLLDSMIGLGEIERGKTLQYAINSLINLYLDGVKMSVFPPIMIQADGVVPSTIRFNPAAKWLITKPGSIEPFPVSPQGINSFQSTYSFLIAALLNMAGTTDTTVTSKTDPGMGKTPEALAMLNQRESSRDNWDRYMMEKSIEEVLNLMVDMVSIKQEKPIELDLFEAEIKQIERDYPDINEAVDIEKSKSGKYGKVIITPKEIGNAKYRFFIDGGTSMKQDDEATNQTAMGLMEMFTQNPALIQALAQDPVKPKKVNLGELVETIVNTSGLPNANKIITDVAPAKGTNPNVPTQQNSQPPQPLPKESINFKDLPPEGQVQMAKQAGIQINPRAPLNPGVSPMPGGPQQPMPMLQGPIPQGVTPGPMPGNLPMMPNTAGKKRVFKDPQIAKYVAAKFGQKGING